MKFLADMGISWRVVAGLRESGHDAVHLEEQGLGRLSDREILSKAQIEGRILLTHDLDFGELLSASGGNLPSVIVFRLSDMRAENVYEHITHLIALQASALENGAVCSVTDKKVRVRNLPINKG
ncbi:MAG: DUF5615 family PIN-like protein [Anaerolineales bacterium]|nr:DUF5615 family PIN-like protein [Anaerolineales bacterium]